ncbi:MAG: VIT1/CCC1 transporter family protein [Promethearchaeota archaeon]
MTKTDEKPYGSEMGTLTRWKLYVEMTDLGDIARRYFVMNFFDGVLTVMGIVIGSFILFLGGNAPTKLEIIVPALATSIAIGISGITGGYLSERAERKRNIIEMHRAMAIHEENPTNGKQSTKFKEEDYYPVNPIKKFEKDEQEKPQIEHIFVDPEPIEIEGTPRGQKREKTLAEKAEKFASWIASLINGVSPAIGGLVVIVPFFFISPTVEDWIIYTVSFVFIGLVLFTLGAYLAKISKDSILKYGIKMTLVGVLTAGLAFLLSFFN